MANPWFRMYSEFATDPKIQMLGEVEQRRYLMLLCLKSCNGDVTLQDEEVAFQLRISNEEYASTKSVLMLKGLIDESNVPTAWDKRQFVSDSSAARVAKHREKKKRSCNVAETKSNALDTDTDTDTDIKNKQKIPFKNFYDKYPIKKGKAPAEKKWKTMPLAKQQEAIAGIEGYIKTVDDLQYASQPPAYLNQERWNDEPIARAGIPANNPVKQLAARNVI